MLSSDLHVLGEGGGQKTRKTGCGHHDVRIVSKRPKGGESGSRCFEKGLNIFPTKAGSQDEAPTKWLEILTTYGPVEKLS